MRKKPFEHVLTVATLSLLSILLVNSSVNAQYGISNARSVAMGGAYTALARGVEAPSWNPANLALPSRKKVQINLFSVGLGFHNNSFSKSQYDIYNGSFLTDENKQDILGSIPAQGLQWRLDTEVQALGIGIGAFAFSATGLGSSDFILSKDVVDLLLNGNELDRVYDVGNTDGEGWAVSSFGLSTALPLSIPLFKKFAVGASLKYLRGHAYGKVQEAESSLFTDFEGIHGNGRIVIDRALGGSGLAIDIGAAAQLNKNISISLGATNLINYLNWSNETKRFTYTFTADSITVQRIENTDLDSVFIDSEETVDIALFTDNLPAELRLGFAHTTPLLTVAVDYKQGLKEAAGVSTTPELAFGTELRLLSFLPLRAGFSIGGNQGFSTAAGFALDFSIFSWDFAVASRRGLFSGKGIGLAFGWMFRL